MMAFEIGLPSQVCADNDASSVLGETGTAFPSMLTIKISIDRFKLKMH
jgi:hypothetical protein